MHGISRAISWLARLGALLTAFVFFADAINADILYAAAIGDLQFQDNPYILDSGTDSTSVVPVQFVPHTNYFALAHFDDGSAKQLSQVPHHVFQGTVVVEDVDSPSVLDGETTSSLKFSLHHYCPVLKIDCPDRQPLLDRTIGFGVMLI